MRYFSEGGNLWRIKNQLEYPAKKSPFCSQKRDLDSVPEFGSASRTQKISEQLKTCPSFPIIQSVSRVLNRKINNTGSCHVWKLFSLCWPCRNYVRCCVSAHSTGTHIHTSVPWCCRFHGAHTMRAVISIACTVEMFLHMGHICSPPIYSTEPFEAHLTAALRLEARMESLLSSSPSPMSCLPEPRNDSTKQSQVKILSTAVKKREKNFSIYSIYIHTYTYIYIYRLYINRFAPCL